MRKLNGKVILSVLFLLLCLWDNSIKFQNNFDNHSANQNFNSNDFDKIKEQGKLKYY